MAYSMHNKRGYFYDVRNNLPYGYYGMHPMDVVEYQRGRPTKLPIRLLNRQFKRTAIQLAEESFVVISVQAIKGKSYMVLANTCSEDDSEEVRAADSVTVPETLAPQLVQQLRKLTKWKPSASGALPSAGQGLVHEDAVFKAHVVNLASGAADAAGAAKLAIKILTESRARDPQERRELSSVLVPLEAASLGKLKTAIADLVITESPLYHTESLQGSDGSKFYLDLIKEEAGHYLKVSHVTRDFRSIVIVPSGDVEALRDLLNTCLTAMKSQPSSQEDSTKVGGAGGKRKRGRNNPRRRPAGSGGGQRRRGAGANAEGKENNGETATPPTSSDSDANAEKAQQQQQQQQQQQSAEPTEDNSTVESRPVESGGDANASQLSKSQ